MRTTPDAARRRCAFTLVELLVVVAIIGLLASIMIPSLTGARERARATLCASNLRQLVLANQLYSQDNRDHACPGAARFYDNLNRWHGTRTNPSSPFDGRTGPLVRYLGPERRIRDCPKFREFITDTSRAFEIGNGGYGYNNAFVGSVVRHVVGMFYQVDTDESGVRLDRIRSPAATLMFADSAFAADELIEYSFSEPRYHPTAGMRADPSIHFRHRSHANVGWCDGHVDSRSLTFTWSSGLYPDDPGRHWIGWFGEGDDNRYFDLN